MWECFLSLSLLSLLSVSLVTHNSEGRYPAHRRTTSSNSFPSASPNTRTSSKNLGTSTFPSPSVRLESSRTISPNGSETTPPCIPE